SVPMTSGSSLVAVLTLYAESADAFSDDQSRLIQMVAPHLAFAIRAAAPPSHATPAAVPEKVATVRELRLIVGRRSRPSVALRYQESEPVLVPAGCATS